MKILSLLPVLLLVADGAMGQTHTFDTGNEGWETNGDATSPTAAWYATGGNPGGYIRVTDQSVGGTWYFQAPGQLLGNKCDAYDTWLRYDQFVSDTNNQQISGGDPDVILFGGGLQLVYDNAVTPGLAWTHYDILLKEDAGWHINTQTGAVPTEAQFRAALADLYGLRIRGEYRAQADFGGLDNFVLESNFGFDLDGDNSSGAYDGDFLADTSCTPFGIIADFDAGLFSGKQIDSIVIRIQFGTTNETLSLDAIPGALDVFSSGLQKITLANAANALPADFLQAIFSMHYFDLSADPARGERIIEFRVYTECGEVAVRYAYLPIYPTPDAGSDGDTLVCAGSPAFDLASVLKGNPDPGGYWAPKTASGSGLFNPDRDKPGAYAYIIPPTGGCPGDTAYVVVSVEPAFRLGTDTTICYDDVLVLDVPSGLKNWQWQDGSHRQAFSVQEPGTYTLTGQTETCTFTDSVHIYFYTCRECPFYAPNVFSPNDDGDNDEWHIYLPCAWAEFHLAVFDRWGSLVFSSDDPEDGWNGFVRGREPVPGVYVWRLEWTGELFGQPKTYREEGDVTVLR